MRRVSWLVVILVAGAARGQPGAAPNAGGPPAAVELLRAQDWRRNNVRELRNVVERMIIAAEAEVIRAEHAPAELRFGGPEPGSGAPDDRRSFQEQREHAERQIVLGALERNQGHVTKTAEELGLADHASLLKIMRRLGIEREK